MHQTSNIKQHILTSLKPALISSNVQKLSGLIRVQTLDPVWQAKTGEGYARHALNRRENKS